MNTAKACEIINDVSNRLGLRFLDTLMYMNEHIDEFWDDEKRAFRLVMRSGQELFAPV